MKRNYSLLFLVLVVSGNVSAQTRVAWVNTNAIPPGQRQTNGPVEFDLTPSVSAKVPNSKAYFNSDARIFLLQSEGVVFKVRARGNHGGRIVSDYDIRAIGSLDVSGLTDTEVYQAAGPERRILGAGYFRGRLFAKPSSGFADGWITVFTSGDGTRIVGITDDGHLCYSADSGISWTDIAAPGNYEFSLATTPKGSRVSAVISLNRIAAVGTRKETLERKREWYAIVSAADGRQLVIAREPGECLPVLSIAKSDKGIVLSWPSSVGGAVLEQAEQIQTQTWVKVTTPAALVDGKYQVILPVETGRQFFRLKVNKSE